MSGSLCGKAKIWSRDDMPFNILVTGASGFVGTVLVPFLAAAGHHVRAASRNPSSAVAAERIESVVHPDLTAMREIDWDVLLAGIDIVVHLAGIAHYPVPEDLDYDLVNRGAAVTLAKACLRHSVRRLIFLSSIAAQTGSAADNIILTETSEPRPQTAYGRSKLAAELEIALLGAPFTILRPVIVYGPTASANIRILIRLAASPWPLPFGALSNRRSLLAVENLALAIAHCFDSSGTLNQTFIVADHDPITIADMFTVMREAMGRSPRLISVSPSAIKVLIAAAGREGLWERIGRELVVSPTKLENAGWRPQIETKEGLAATMKAFVCRRADF
jgi:nucleoside-diphosphate-sugar epimerase